MKKLAILPTLLFIGTLSSNLWGADLEYVKLQGISSTGKSLVLDRGTLENFSEGHYARFYLQKGTKEYPKLFLVAEGELVKSFPKKSFWLLQKIHIPNAITYGSKLLILTTQEVNSGRSLKIKTRTSVRPADEYQSTEDFLIQNKEITPERFVRNNNSFEASPDIFETDPSKLQGSTRETDVLVTKYETFKNKSGNYYSEDYGDLSEQKYFVDNKEIPLGDIRKKEDKKLFDTMNANYVQQTNDMPYGIHGFYKDQEKIKESPDVTDKGSIDSMYDELKEKRKNDNKLDPKVLAKYKRDGEMWSADMDDSTLRKYFIQTGIEKEAKRRELALSELDGNEIMFHYSNGLGQHGNSTDQNNQGRGYNFGLSYDLHLSRTSQNLKQWSLQFIVEKESSSYDTGVYNAKSSELSYGAYVNYYFVNTPLTLNSFIMLAGVGVKSGMATLSSGELSKEYSYQVLSIPALQVMTKYRFRSGDLTEENVNAGASLNFGINIDIKNLSSVDTISDDINSKISVTDLKYTLGMSVYF